MALFSNVFPADPVKKLQPLVEQINALEGEFEKLSNEEVKQKTEQWKKEITEKAANNGEVKKVLDDYLVPAFALVREAAKRAIGQRHYDVQLLGGIVLHQGKIAEMKTGEGKTLVATLPLYLNALAGRGAHLVTVNDYLARLQGSWMGKIFHALGLSTGVVQHAASYIFDPGAKIPEVSEESAQGVILDVENLIAVSRPQAYAADVTYGTNNEFGFDYLRDNMVQELAQISQREQFFAIVDEVDSILIDEARTPLIISAPDTESTERYKQFEGLVGSLRENDDYNVDEKHKAVTLTEQGIHTLEKLLGVDNIYVEGGVTTVHHIEQALRAKSLFINDRDYVVKNGEVIIVDEFTGRLMYGRRYSEGLHQAIEAKENVQVQQETKTLATITFQNLFRLYDKLAGMTGTATTEAEEFHKIYNLDVVAVPTHKPVARLDESDLIYQTEKGKFEAVAQDVKRRHEAGQPVLIGTTSIARNEELSDIFKRFGIPHELLNAKNHEREAHIIAQAGRLAAVTVATNMAGRGVDIMLGGIPPQKIKDQKSKIKIEDSDDSLTPEYKKWREEFKKVTALGGLHVIGTERHESRRIDNQLRGRSGRQGDPGSSQFYLSLGDDLIRLFGGDKIKGLVARLGLPEDQPITTGMVSRTIEGAQKKIEGLNFDRRKHVVEYDDVINKHRTVIYTKRRNILTGDEDLRAASLDALNSAVNSAVMLHSSADNVDKNEIQEIINTIFPIADTERTIIATEVDPELLSQKLQERALAAYEARETTLGEKLARSIEKFVWLRMMDQFWQEHLDTMDHLRDSVRLRGYGQRDPLIEYKREAFALFERLLDTIETHVAHTLFKVTVDVQQPQNVSNTFRNTAGDNKVGLPSEASAKVGRNDPCPCGSGRKWKKCGMINSTEHQQFMSKKQA